MGVLNLHRKLQLHRHKYSIIGKMLDKTGDLIPVRYEAVNIPWTKRKSQVLNFIHRGTVRFETQVYDTNVGDISPLSSYFNPQRWTVRDLNEKFGIQTQTPELSVGVDAASPVPEGDEDISEAVHRFYGLLQNSITSHC